MSAKKHLKAYLFFGKRDRLGAIIIVLIPLSAYFLPILFSRKKDPFPLKESTILANALDTLADQKKDKDNNIEEIYYTYEPTYNPGPAFTEGALFQFDPNTLSAVGWKKLGLSDRLIRTINNYRSKGGHFYKPEDLKRIWGLPEAFYDRVKNYIVITSMQRSYSSSAYKPFIPEKRELVLVNINEGDTTAFIALPGIGSRLAARIINFREKLGGFYSIDQIGETYGLPDSTFQVIKSQLVFSGEIKKLNVNTATKDELKAHPYIRWSLANAIVEYRSQHGPYKTLEELKNIAVLDEGTFSKLLPYLSL